MDPTPALALGSLGAAFVAIGYRRRRRRLVDALIGAVKRDSREDLERLLASGADLNGWGSGGRTPLMAATFSRRTDMVQRLLQLGADPNRADRYGTLPLH